MLELLGIIVVGIILAELLCGVLLLIFGHKPEEYSPEPGKLEDLLPEPDMSNPLYTKEERL